MTGTTEPKSIAARLFLLLAIGFGAFGSVCAAAADGDTNIFLTHCAPCHGADGRARTPAARKLNVKDLTQSKLPDAEIKRQIVDGRRDPAGKQQMPAFGDKLTDKQITALIAQVKAFRK
jgi:mono/diheme cytochrome c family protein